jgi:hypothetical protein
MFPRNADPIMEIRVHVSFVDTLGAPVCISVRTNGCCAPSAGGVS